MIYITRVKVESLNRSGLVDPEWECALERACARAWNVERGDRAIRSAQDAVIHIARVKRTSRDHPCGVKAKAGKNKGALAGPCAGVRSIKRSDGAVWSAQEAVSHIARVNVASRDRLRRIDVAGEGTLARTCARTRDVEGSDGTVRSAQETVNRTARVGVASRNRPCRVDGEGDCALAGACTRPRSIECGDGGLRPE